MGLLLLDLWRQNKSMKRITALILALSGALGALSLGTIAVQAVTVKGPIDIDSLSPTLNGIADADDSENDGLNDKNAWVILGNDIKEKNITFFDGALEDKKSPTYNEKVIIDGVEARKVYQQNYIYLKLDDKFYDKENDHDFFIKISLYQFGPDRGRLYLQYPSETGSKTLTIWKEKDPMWVTMQVYIGDADFDHSIDDVGADIKIISGVYNAFSKIEIVNARNIKYDNDFDVETLVSAGRADTLKSLGLYSFDEKENYLKNKLTKASAAAKIVKILGREKEALKYNSNMSGISAEESHAIGYLKSNNYADWDGGADEPVSQKELVEAFANIQGLSTEGDVMQTAIDKGLLTKSDMMMQPGKTAIDDNLITLGYRWLIMPGKHGVENIVDMMNENLIDENKLKDASEVRIQGLYYTKPRKLKKTEIIDATTGRRYYCIDKDGAQLVREYYTANLWTADNKRFIVEDAWEGSPKYIYDTEKNTLQYLANCYNLVVSKDTDRMYYMCATAGNRQVRRIDLNTLKVETVADIPYNLTGSEDATITNDEKYFAVNWEEGSDELDYAQPFGGLRKRKVPVLDIETGVWNNTFHHEFVGYDREGMILNHVQINPVYDNLALFAHEGTAEKTPDRLWMVDLDKNEAFNVFRQKQVSEERTGEPAGHEMWFGNGERIAFVKYPKSGNIAHSGIMTIDLTGKHKEYVNGDYQYWHCAASPADDRFIVADTNNIVNGTIEIVLIDRYTGEAHLLCKPRLGYTSHPGHAHPSFSQDGRKISFVVKTSNNVIGTAWMDISDIIDKPLEGGRISISDDCEVPSYKGTKNYIEEKVKDGEACYKIPAEKRMLVNVKDEKYQGDRVDARISFSYYDEGFMPVRLAYFGWDENSTILDKTEQMIYDIPRKNTKKWITETIELKDINLDNMEYVGTDFRIESPYADLYVKDIKVEVTNIISDFMDQRTWSKLYKTAE